MATFAQRITELIGSDYTTIASNSVSDLFNAAVNEVADMVPPELLLKYAVDPIDLDENTTTWTAVEGKKVLLVTRLDDSSPRLAQECKPVSIQDFEKSRDANSIYLATKHTPVYAYITDAGTTALTILPEPIVHEDVKVYYFAYSGSDITGNSSIGGLPSEIFQAVVLKACINILQTYISDFVQDEEDSEMQNMLLGQTQTLKEQFQGEMARFTDKEDKVRGE
jgi:hypothetical protein